ncbi:MAG: ABC transporter permease [Mycoplasma sp.]|nr:ABC transporter permease [Mycoplasma sp.]
MPNKLSQDEFNSKYGISQNDEKLIIINDNEVKDQVQLSGKPVTNWKSFLTRFFRNKMTVISLIVFIGIIITGVVVTGISAYGPNDKVSAASNFIISDLPPSSTNGGWVHKVITTTQLNALYQLFGESASNHPHIRDIKVLGPGWLSIEMNPYDYFNATGTSHKFIIGTNAIGQDIWVRVWHGTLNSLKLALLVATVESIVGIAIGAWIGFYAGSRMDTYVMRAVDTLNGIPQLIWFILLTFMLPQGFWSLFIALVSIGWITPLYQARMFMIKVKDQDYIAAARTSGNNEAQLIFKHALPNTLGKLLSRYVSRIPSVIIIQASLAFLGLTSTVDASLGVVVNDAKSHLENIWYLLTPTLILFAITLSLQFVANGINDALDPKVGK